MKKSFVFIFTIFMGLMFIFASHPGPKLVNLKDLDLKGKPMDTQPGGGVKPDINFGRIPLYFITNKGQVNEKAKFYAKASKYTLWLTKEGLVFDSFKKVKVKAEVEEEAAPFGQIINAFGKDTNKDKEVPGKVLSSVIWDYDPRSLKGKIFPPVSKTKALRV